MPNPQITDAQLAKDASHAFDDMVSNHLDRTESWASPSMEPIFLTE